MYSHYCHARFVLILSSLLTAFTALGDDDVFAISEISNEGRAVTAAFADFDGDGRTDVVVGTQTSTSLGRLVVFYNDSE